MKIRIKGNSVRLRLTKTEVEAFCKKGHFSQTTEFNTQVFKYELIAKKDIDGLRADFKDNAIIVFFPQKHSKGWAEDSRVGFKNDFELDNGSVLSLLVEKDFTCLDDRDEDESDNYPNPLAMKS